MKAFLFKLAVFYLACLIEYVAICIKLWDENTVWGYGQECQLNANNYNCGCASSDVIHLIIKVSRAEVQVHI